MLQLVLRAEGEDEVVVLQLACWIGLARHLQSQKVLLKKVDVAKGGFLVVERWKGGILEPVHFLNQDIS